MSRGPSALTVPKKNLESSEWQSVQPWTPKAWRAGRTSWPSGQATKPAA
jgi:hypothetical protein